MLKICNSSTGDSYRFMQKFEKNRLNLFKTAKKAFLGFTLESFLRAIFFPKKENNNK